MDLKFFKSYWRLMVALALPVVFLPLAVSFKDNVNAGRCGYVLIIMGLYWVLELLPLAVTGLFPAFLFPLLGIMKASDVAPQYFQDSVMLGVGGLMVALAVEQTNLHKRIALGVLLIVGTKPYWIMAGFMVIAATLSMFISNTATTAMILPIAVAVIMESNRHRLFIEKSRSQASLATLEMHAVNFRTKLNDPVSRFMDREPSMGLMPDSSAMNISEAREKAEKMEIPTEVNFASLTPRQQEISKALVLSVAYASSIGGMATITGTLPNVILLGIVNERYGSDGLSYASYSFFALPTMLMCLIFAFCWLTFQFFIFPYLRTRVSESDPEMEKSLKEMFRQKYRELGPMSFGEGSTLGIFITLVLLWLTRSPGFFDGWSTGFKKDYISDATPAVLLALLLFLWPMKRPSFGFGSSDEKSVKYEAILTWKVVARRFPWDVVLLLGGALSLAEGVKVSGLADVMKTALQSLDAIPAAAMCALMALVVTFCTEFASNTAIAGIFLPVVADLAEASHIHPLYYMLPVTLSCSFAFMFPVATPPNAIVFSSGFLKVVDMVKAGVILNFACLGITVASVHTFGQWVYNVGEYPAWAPQTAATTAATSVAANFS